MTSQVTLISLDAVIKLQDCTAMVIICCDLHLNMLVYYHVLLSLTDML